jgi:hypothetical protein
VQLRPTEAGWCFEGIADEKDQGDAVVTVPCHSVCLMGSTGETP